MFKKLDRLIIKAFVGPFLATFVIALFVLVMQFFWKYIDDLVGKGLDSFTLLELTGLVTANWVPLALPLAILLSSIMTFGNLGESFELVAIKSAGIPLLRFMRPLMIITFGLCIVAFVFANNVIPVATFKLETLLQDIRLKKPAFDLKEGVFYDKLPGYSIKIGHKDKTATKISDVVIFENNPNLQDNLIVAKKGQMTLSSDKLTLNFKIENGTYYQEKGMRFSPNTDFIRMGFGDYTKHFDLSALSLNRSEDSLYKNNSQMLSMRQLAIAIDSLRKEKDEFARHNNMGIATYFHIASIPDSSWKQAQALVAADTPRTPLMPDSVRHGADAQAYSTLTGLEGQVNIQDLLYEGKETNIRMHLVEWHRKLALSAACFVLFLIGAPLGSIIRKGGIGMPLVCAVVFFVIFHLLNTFGEKFAKSGYLSPLEGMWMSVICMTPIGVFLTYKAMQDSQLFNKEFYYRMFGFARDLIKGIVPSKPQ